ncbi:glutamine amidotransferase subunit [Microbotryomycetes sp. JL201]|nr:glutamine amidotransferase subunit [Microbotryomycetes sp. JL201]
MCRLLVVKSSEPIRLSQLLTEPAHSIINQASDSRLRLDAGSINADGFGVAFYPTETDPSTPLGPCIFRSITPAWSNQNLHRLAERVKSRLTFAHVRASTTGALSEENTHPWSFGNLVWMHNGCISGFRQILRTLQAGLRDQFFHFVQGNTDSEWAFACFLEQLARRTDVNTRNFPHSVLREAMLATVSILASYTREAGVQEPSLMNFCVSDGVSVVATRYITSATEEAASLFYSTGSTFEEVEPGVFRMHKTDKREKIILIASEPLTFERADWVEIPSQSCVVLTSRNNLLKYPIVDMYFQDGPASVRHEGYAQRKGYRWHRSAPLPAAAVGLTH